jgi:hypothetical protein
MALFGINQHSSLYKTHRENTGKKGQQSLHDDSYYGITRRVVGYVVTATCA